MNFFKKNSWQIIADSIAEINFQANNMCVTEVNGKKITLVKNGEAIFACAYKCPHASGILADGFVDGMNNIICPLHRYKFSLQNGKNISGEGYYLKTYPVKVEDGKISVEMLS